MKIYAKDGKEFTDVQKCMEYEKELDEKALKVKEEKEKLMANRKARADEIQAAYDAIQNLIKEYNTLIDKFCKDYGSYHFSYTSENKPRWSDLIDFLCRF